MKTLIKLAESKGMEVERIGNNQANIYTGKFEIINGRRCEIKINVWKNYYGYFINNNGLYTLKEAITKLEELLNR